MNKKRMLSSILMAFAFSLVCVLTSAQPSGGPYGPVPVDYEIPHDANVVYYVAPNGDANNSGLSLDEPSTIEQVLSKAVSNDAIIMRGGIYRIGNLEFNQGITMQPYKNEKPVLKGTYLADKWTKLRTDLWICEWAHFFPSKPQEWWTRTRQGMWTPLYKFNDDMVFVDGKYLDVVGWEGDVDENSYYIDYDNGLVYIGVNPEGREVEITAFNIGLHRVIDEVNGNKSDKKGFNLRGIKLTQYAYRAIEIDGYDPEGISPESEHGKDVVGTNIENCEISYCSRVAGYFRGDGLTMRNNRISDTSTEGVYILASNDVLLERNIFMRNNIENITGYFPSAVKIFNQCYRVTCNDNLVLDHPNSNGIWYDVGNVDGVFTNNWMENVGNGEGKTTPGGIWPAMNGFFFEISKGAICAGNVFVNCNHGLMSLNSSGVKAYNNTFFNSMAVFARSERSAEGDHFGWHPATGPGVEERHGHVFVNNLLVADDNFDLALMTVWQSPLVCERVKGTPFNQIENNVYVRSKSYDYSPVLWWAPANNDKCCMPIGNPSELNDLYAGHGANSIFLDNYEGAVFKSPQLHNFELLPHFTEAAGEAKIPSDVKKLINRNKEKGVGAYPITK